MKKNRILSWVIVVCIITLMLLSISPIGTFAEELGPLDYENMDDFEPPKPVKGKVLEILKNEIKRFETSGDDMVMDYQQVEIRILEGDYKDTVIVVDNYIDAYNMVVEKGYTVLLYLDVSTDGELQAAFILEIVRERYLFYLVAAFALLLIVLGGLKGLKVILTLVLTGLAVLKVLLPLTIRGYPPVLVSVSICIAVIVMTLLIINGINKKSMSAIIGTTGGVLVAGAIALIVGTAARLTGMGNEYAQLLMYTPSAVSFDFRGLLFAGIILGSMGAVMDVSMSIASAMHEIETIKPGISPRELIRSGMNVGRDVMGTMSNTLILAYAGGSLHLMLLFSVYEVPFNEIINKDIIASEVLRAMAGSIGLLFVIPLTAVVAGTIGKKKAPTVTENLSA